MLLLTHRRRRRRRHRNNHTEREVADLTIVLNHPPQPGHHKEEAVFIPMKKHIQIIV